jgi:hypothetical protein
VSAPEGSGPNLQLHSYHLDYSHQPELVWSSPCPPRRHKLMVSLAADSFLAKDSRSCCWRPISMRSSSVSMWSSSLAGQTERRDAARGGRERPTGRRDALSAGGVAGEEQHVTRGAGRQSTQCARRVACWRESRCAFFSLFRRLVSASPDRTASCRLAASSLSTLAC